MSNENQFIDMLKAHTENEERRFNAIEHGSETIKNNHLAHIEEDISDIQKKQSTHSSDIGWIKWLVTTTLGAVIVGIISAVLALILK